MNGDSQIDDVETPGGNIQPVSPIPEGSEVNPPAGDQNSGKGAIPYIQEEIPATPTGVLLPKDHSEPSKKLPNKDNIFKSKKFYFAVGFLGWYIFNITLGLAFPSVLHNSFPSIFNQIGMGSHINTWYGIVLLLNVVLMLFLGFKNRSIVSGALSAIAALFIVALVLALVVVGSCYFNSQNL